MDGVSWIAGLCSPFKRKSAIAGARNTSHFSEGGRFGYEGLEDLELERHTWSSSSVRGNATAHRDAAGSGGIAEAVATEQIGL